MIQYDLQRHHRRSIRLKGYDYGSSGAYFVTICTQGRECILVDPVVFGIIRDVWFALPRWFPTVGLDEFVIMPNHVHFILWIYPPDDVPSASSTPVGAGASPAPTGEMAQGMAKWVVPEPQRVNPNPTLGDVVGAFKSLVFRVYLDWVQTHDPTRQARFWQRNYYEHIIRDEQELEAVRRYIRRNPDNWIRDRDNPGNVRHLPPPQTVDGYWGEAVIGDG